VRDRAEPIANPTGEDDAVDSDEIRALDDEVRALAAVAERLTERLDAMERTIAARPPADEGDPRLAQRIERIEAASRALAERVDRLDASFDPGGEATRPQEAASQAGGRDINRMTFEDLRGLGLSINQAARLVSQRDARGGFDSLEDLNTLYGFPRDQIEALKQAVTIEAG
jgi:DNA uptake protein ComE-like DNA-binding protein